MSRTTSSSLSTLRSHSIFLPPGNDPTTEDDWELVTRPTDPLVGQKMTRVALRDKSLLVAVGKEVRMTSVAGGEGWDVKDGIMGHYKVGFPFHFPRIVDDMGIIRRPSRLT